MRLQPCSLLTLALGTARFMHPLHDPCPPRTLVSSFICCGVSWQDLRVGDCFADPCPAT